MYLTDQHTALKQYYKLHAPFYDATRWSFLFGRRRLLDSLPALPSQPRILEIGCGTGRNLACLHAFFPDAHIVGMDLSDAMLQKAAHKTASATTIKLIKHRYGVDTLDEEPFHLVILSYSLTMMGPRLEPILQQAASDLAPQGLIAAVDFHATPFTWFQRWMQANHVIMEGNLLPLLERSYHALDSSVHRAYGGLWSYFQFIGKKY